MYLLFYVFLTFKVIHNLNIFIGSVDVWMPDNFIMQGLYLTVTLYYKMKDFVGF